MTEALSQKEAAKRLGVSERTLRRHTTDGKVSRDDDGTYRWPFVWEQFRAFVVPQEHVTQKEAAKRLGLSDRRVRTLTGQQVLHRGSDGMYPFPRVAAEYEAYTRGREEEQAGDIEEEEAEDFFRARARKTAAEADIAEMDSAKLRGELIHRRDVAALVRAPLEAVNRKLKAAPQRLAKRWAGAMRMTEAEALVLIRDMVEDVRSELQEIADAA